MIVFPMAGLSSRFAEFGYTQPKYMLPLWDGVVFDYAVSSFADEFSKKPFLFIFREVNGARRFIEKRVSQLGISTAVLIELSDHTGGQAETVEQGLKQAGFDDSAPLTIFNIDTFRRPSSVPTPNLASLSGWLEVFEGEGSGWSFVKPSDVERGLATATTEKVPISNLCSTGLYHFESAASFHFALDEERAAPTSSELYVAPLYNHLIDNNHRVGYELISKDDLEFCGTPDDYENLLQRPPTW